MKVAISASGNDLNSLIDPRFGRCPYFLFVETDDMSCEVLDNESRALGGGAGIQSAQFVASKGAKAVITGHCGPNAVDTLSAAGIELFLGNTGTVRETLEKFKKGKLSTATEANAPEYSGLKNMPAGSGMGRGVGGGRGMGGRGLGGGGRGMGGGRGLGSGRKMP
ncbi:MAG: NifB/NifX family molybdenum-iron cluster-binding protein [Deltaproteobacteria bacterium]|nr:NifB/NifX family molybdenum-iron cluster-binding protein [Deltaproteobacteria bacterium]